MLKRLILVLLVCVLPTFAVDTLTVTAVGGQFSKIEWNWTADGSGNASGVTTDVCPGVLFSFSTVPDTVQVPTDNYDITIKNQLPSVTGSDVTLATDLAGGLIADRDNVNTELVEFWPTGIRQSSGKIRLDISNAGSGKKGKAVLVIYRTLAIVSTSGSFQVPIGGATTQMLQWFSSGQAKWITLSGDVAIADGGALTIANGAITRAKTAITGTPTGSKFLRDDWSWQAPGGGSGVGDVVGPASATNGGIVLFDLTTGKLIKDSTYTFPLADAQVADTLTASIFKGSGTTTNAVDLATAEVSGTLPAASVGTGLTDAQVSDTLTISSGSTMSSPPAIGGTTPAAGTFTVVKGIKSGTPLSLFSGTAGSVQNSTTTTTDCFLSIISGNAASSRLFFGDTDSESAGQIWYTHGTGMNFLVEGMSRINLTTTGADVTGAFSASGAISANLASSGAIKIGDGTTAGARGLTFNTRANDADQAQILWQSAGSNKWLLYRDGNSDNVNFYSFTNAASLMQWSTTGVTDTRDMTINGSTTLGDATGDTVTIPGSTALSVNSLSIAKPTVAGTWKTKTPIWLSAASITPTTTNGCTTPALNASDSWAAAMAASTNGFWQITIPSDYDGSTENINLWYYKSDTNAVQWTISEIDFADNVADTTTYNAGTAQSDTPVANNIQKVTISASALFGTTSNAGNIAKVKITTNAYSGTTAYLMGVKIEY